MRIETKTLLAGIGCAAALALAPSADAANIAAATPNPLTTTYTVDTGDQWAGTGLTLDINAGGSLVIANAQFDTIVQQNAAGTTTINVNTGGTVDTSGAAGGGVSFLIGNNVAAATGILNINGGNFDGSGLTHFVIGRDNATGIVNISAGSMTLGSAPIFDTGTNEGGAAAGNGWINFTAGSTGTLAIANADQAYYEGLYAAGQLQYAGGNAGSFGARFAVAGDTIEAIPEPGSLALLGLGGLAILRRRR